MCVCVGEVGDRKSLSDQSAYRTDLRSREGRLDFGGEKLAALYELGQAGAPVPLAAAALRVAAVAAAHPPGVVFLSGRKNSTVSCQVQPQDQKNAAAELGTTNKKERSARQNIARDTRG